MAVMTRITIAAIFLLGLSHAASTQSFDCAKAQTRVEKMICAEPALRELDEHLGRYYAAGRTEVGDAASCLQTNQTHWLRSTRNVCQNATCLKNAYLNRLAELDGLQPGATAIRNITLPRVPVLMWVIPAAADNVAAPNKANARPLELTGVVVEEIENGGDGFMLRTSNGTKVPLMLLMFYEDRTRDRLTVLAKDTGARFRARGFAASDSRRTYFEPSRCTFIHRLP